MERKGVQQKKGHGEEVVKILVGGKILEVREDSGDLVTISKQLLWSPRILG